MTPLASLGGPNPDQENNEAVVGPALSKPMGGGHDESGERAADDAPSQSLEKMATSVTKPVKEPPPKPAFYAKVALRSA